MKKLDTLKLTLLMLSSLLFISCTDEDTQIITPTDSEIEFSTSPIDLQGISANFAQNIAYDSKERTLFDVWLPNSSTPTGLVVYIHGGGFRGGDKDFVYSSQKNGLWNFPEDIRAFLSNNIAFATVQYSLLEDNETEGVKKPLNDVRRALQYIRSRAQDFNIAKEKIVLGGNSAGGGAALWIAFNDDMAEPNSSDAVLRESTRIKGVAVRETQASYNIEDKWINNVFIDYGITWAQFSVANQSIIGQFYGVSSTAEYNSTEIDAYRSDVDMLELLTSDDPALWVDNTLRDVVFPSSLEILNHHAYHARELKEKADLVGVENVTYYGRSPILFSQSSGENWVDFSTRKLSE